jgi:LysR family hydrogen peroxide-inducible transcriptional activator
MLAAASCDRFAFGALPDGPKACYAGGMSLAGLNLRDFEYIVAVAEERHFGRAAARCHVSQSALSVQVRKVEELLGIQIFERTNRRVVVTALGERVVERARALLQVGQELIDLRGLGRRPFGGGLTLGAIPTVGPYLIPLVLRELLERYPEVDLTLNENITTVLVQGVRQGELDAAIVSLPIADPDIATVELFFEPFVLAARRGEPLLTKPGLKPADLSPTSIILLADGHCLREQALEVCGAHLKAGMVPLQATGLDILLQMIAVRGGYSLIPLLAIERLDDLEGLIAFRAFEPPPPGRMLGLIHRHTSAKADDLHKLAELLRGARRSIGQTQGKGARDSAVDESPSRRRARISARSDQRA